MGWLKRKAAAIDTRRWALVDGLLNDDEELLHNTPCKVHFDTPPAWDAFAFVTSEAFLSSSADGSKGLRIDFEQVKLIEAEPGYKMAFRIGWRDEDGTPNALVFELFPSPLSTELWQAFVAGVKASKG